MPVYRKVGDVSPKRHTRHTDSHGRLLYEELFGEDGFSADSSLLYHRHVPSAITGAHEFRLPDSSIVPNHPLRPRHMRAPQLFPSSGAMPAGPARDVVTARRLLVGNDDVRISYVVADGPSPLYRNAAGDELVYVESGTARVETALGALDVGDGDYVVMPRATVHRWIPAVGTEVRGYVIEAAGHIRPPARYLSRTGQFLEHAPYCERDLRAPSEVLLADGEAVDVIVKHRAAGTSDIVATRHTYARHPFDVVGWDGCNYPFAFNVRDFEPITGRVHQPPPVHQVFEAPGFVVCNFVPRRADYHPSSVQVPYYHSNADSDEVMFYCGGNYAARKGSGIGQASVTLHPAGHVHGPSPVAYEREERVDHLDELAVMVDTFRPLGIGEGGRACDDADYAWSWVAR